MDIMSVGANTGFDLTATTSGPNEMSRRIVRLYLGGVGGVFGLITVAMVIMIVTLAAFGPNARG
jgi:hypothetical protein